MLNVPTGSSNLLIAQPQGFLNRAMTLFLRTTIAALDNQGVGQSNISLFQRIPMLAYMTSVSFGVYCLKTYLAGGEEGFQRNVLDKIDSGPMGNAQLVAQALDYSGYLGIISSKALNFALDAGSESFYQRANAGEYQLMSPVQSFGIQAGRSLVNAAGSGFDVENLSSMDRRTLRKLFGLGLFDTTFGQLIFDKGLNNKMTEHTQIENFSNWLYPENDN
jgi:hypothetical protein